MCNDAWFLKKQCVCLGNYRYYPRRLKLITMFRPKKKRHIILGEKRPCLSERPSCSFSLHHFFLSTKAISSAWAPRMLYHYLLRVPALLRNLISISPGPCLVSTGFWEVNVLSLGIETTWQAPDMIGYACNSSSWEVEDSLVDTSCLMAISSEIKQSRLEGSSLRGRTWKLRQKDVLG